MSGHQEGVHGANGCPTMRRLHVLARHACRSGDGSVPWRADDASQSADAKASSPRCVRHAAAPGVSRRAAPAPEALHSATTQGGTGSPARAPAGAAGDDAVWSADDVEAARAAGRCVVIIEGGVYDVTSFLDDHPGGRDVIESSRAADATAAWTAVRHSSAATRMRDAYRVGTFDAAARGRSSGAADAGGTRSSAPRRPPGTASDDTLVPPVTPTSYERRGVGKRAIGGVADFPGPEDDPAAPGKGQVELVRSHFLSMHRISEEWTSKYGPVMEYHVGRTPILQVADTNVGSKVWRANPPKPGSLGRLASRAKPGSQVEIGEGTYYDDLRAMFGEGLLTCPHEVWPQRRRLLRPSFAIDRVGESLPLVWTYALRLCDRIESHTAGAAERGRGVTDAKEALQETAFQIIVRAVLGPVAKTLLGAEITPLRHAFEIGFNSVFTQNTRTAEFREAIAAMRAFTAKAVAALHDLEAAHSHTPAATPSPSKCPVHPHPDAASGAAGGEDAALRGLDVLRRLVSARGVDDSLDDEGLRGELVTLMIAGHETSANTMSWTVYELAKNPVVLRRLQAEVDALFDRLPAGAQPSYDDLQSLEYLTKVIREVLRLHTIVHTVSRQLEEPMTLAGKEVPEGTVVNMSLWAMHHRRDVWGDAPPPDVFDPDRPWRDDSFRPFSVGPRDCLGRNFAMLEVRAIVSLLARRFDIHPAGHFSPREVAYLTVQPEEVLVRFVPRRR